MTEPTNSKPTNETGFWRLTEDHLSSLLARNDLSWEIVRVYLALGYLTIGYRKVKDVVSLGQIAELAHVEHRNTVRALRRLADLGLYGEKKIGERKVIRWITWPAPKVSGRKPRHSVKADTTLSSVNDSVSQDTVNSVNASIKVDTPPVSQSSNPEGAAAPPSESSGEGGKLVKLWIDSYHQRVGCSFPKSGIGQLAGTIKNMVASFTADVLSTAIARWFSCPRRDYGIALFKLKVEGADTELLGRAGGASEDQGLAAVHAQVRAATGGEA